MQYSVPNSAAEICLQVFFSLLIQSVANSASEVLTAFCCKKNQIYRFVNIQFATIHSIKLFIRFNKIKDGRVFLFDLACLRFEMFHASFCLFWEDISKDVED